MGEANSPEWVESDCLCCNALSCLSELSWWTWSSSPLKLEKWKTLASSACILWPIVAVPILLLRAVGGGSHDSDWVFSWRQESVYVCACVHECIVCACVCMCMCTCVHLYVWVHMEAEVNIRCLLPSLSRIFWDQASSWTWRSLKPDWPASKPKGSSCLCLPNTGVRGVSCQYSPTALYLLSLSPKNVFTNSCFSILQYSLSSGHLLVTGGRWQGALPFIPRDSLTLLLWAGISPVKRLEF